MKEAKILVGIPTRDGRGDYVTYGFLCAEMARRGDVRWIPKQDTILTSGHNQLWATALTWRRKHGLQYYLNLHDDVRPAPDFISAMIRLLEFHQCDLLGCSVSIKDDRGLTSTCVTFFRDGQCYRRRITLKEMQQLPEVFGVEDVCKLYGYDSSKCFLGVNTGLMLVNLKPDWVEDLYFTINDRIVKLPDDEFQYQVEPEDWFFSRLVCERGGKVMCSRLFEVQHLGIRKFSSFEMIGYEHDWDCGIPELQRSVEACANGSGLVHGSGGAASLALCK